METLGAGAANHGLPDLGPADPDFGRGATLQFPSWRTSAYAELDVHAGSLGRTSGGRELVEAISHFLPAERRFGGR